VSEKPHAEPEVRVVDRRWWARGETDTSGEPAASGKPTYVEELEKQLADRANQIQKFQVEHRRAQEEFEQVKARLRRDIGREVERGRRSVIVELLDVLDNLDRAIAVGRDASPTALLEGVELVRQQFLAKLEGLGVTRVPALGEPFDAVRHEAVTTTAVDRDRDGTVVAVIKEGYAVGDEVLRPASVVVGQCQ
jgi:molecular chaperone GrpE (heat shock protein)